GGSGEVPTPARPSYLAVFAEDGRLARCQVFLKLRSV
ncbi:unnamed protein product, partial [Urochloa humidicola]